MTALHLDFERPIVEKEREIAELHAATDVPEDERARRLAQLEADRDGLRRTIFSELSPIQRVQLARHPRRPFLLDYVSLVFEDWLELHGDRAFAEDRAMVGGLARLDGRSLVLIGQQKGRDTKENLRRNFGMPHPEGYRKALRLMKLAEKFGLPVVTLIDTPGAYPGIGAEERGQAEAIARNLREMAALRVPLLSVVTGEGASGGALGIGVTDRILMLENAFYSVISPEGCAAILWNDGEMRAEAARAMKITAKDLLDLGISDEILPEPLGGAHTDWPGTARVVADAIRRHVRELSAKDADTLIAERMLKYRRMGRWQEAPGVSGAPGTPGAPPASNTPGASSAPGTLGAPTTSAMPTTAGPPANAANAGTAANAATAGALANANMTEDAASAAPSPAAAPAPATAGSPSGGR